MIMMADDGKTVEEQAEVRALVSYRKKVGRKAPIPTGTNAGKATQRWFETLRTEALNEIIQENADRTMCIVRPRERAPTFRKWVGTMLGRAVGKRV
jgi:hypothetical protein